MPKDMKKKYIIFPSQIGEIRVEGLPDLVTRLRLPGEMASDFEDLEILGANEAYPALEEAAEWLNKYFAGEAVTWEIHAKPSFNGFTAKIYESLLKVPFGVTVSYGELAEMAGNRNAARAVGRAMATNPLAILIPCHRVLGSDGSLHGYGGGLPMKKALLEHEGVAFR